MQRQGEHDEDLLGKLTDSVGPAAGQEESQHEGSCLLPGLCHRDAGERGSLEMDPIGLDQKARNGDLHHRVCLESDQGTPRKGGGERPDAPLDNSLVLVPG